MDFLKGWKTKIAVAGLVGLALYQLTQAAQTGDLTYVEMAMKTLLEAAALFGIRMAVTR